MTTRERAYDIFSRMDERQLEGFITMFGIYFPEDKDKNDDLDKRTRAFSEIDRLTHAIDNLDYDKELAEYREERYGK